jgi:predicted nucleic acid-binding protein
MNDVFADTAYYVALVSPRDAWHRVAREFNRVYGGRFVTTEFVLIETANFFAKAAVRPVFVDLVRDLRADPRTTVVPASADLFERALQLFAARPDKDWSLTDCTSFEVMRDRGLTDALTADRHFVQAGFQILLA